MRERFQELGISETMIYDLSGRLRVHVASNTIRRPRRPPEPKQVETLATDASEADKRRRSGYAWRVEGLPEAAGHAETAESPKSEVSSEDDDG